MTPLRLDPDLAFPRDVPSVPPIPEVEGGLVRAGRAEGGPLLLAGRRSTARVHPLRGVAAVTADELPLCGAMRLNVAPAANLLATPRSATLERVGSGGTLLETVLVPERLPGVVVQWTGAAGAAGVRLEVELPRAATRVHVDGPRLRWAGSSDDGGGVWVLASTGARPEWTLLDDDPESGVVRAGAVIPVSAGESSTLVMSGVAAGTRLPSLTALAAVAAHRLRDSLEPDDAPGLRLHTGVADLDDGVAWARALLRGLLAGSGESVRLRLPSSADLAGGGLAAAELEFARAALSSDSGVLDDPGAYALWVGWTGEGGPLLDVKDALRGRLDSATPAIRKRVADAAEAVGEEAWAAELRRPVSTGSGRALPTLSKAAPPTIADPAADAPDSGGVWEAVRLALAELRSKGPSGDPVVAADALGGLVHGVLGAEPDAAYGRLTLRPEFPDHWTAFEASGLALADARLEVSWTREAGRHRFRLRQTAGGAPITWILEPRLRGGGLIGAYVDGEPAELEAPREGPYVRPRIQLPAERERLVDLEVSPP